MLRVVLESRSPFFIRLPGWQNTCDSREPRRVHTCYCDTRSCNGSEGNEQACKDNQRRSHTVSRWLCLRLHPPKRAAKSLSHSVALKSLRSCRNLSAPAVCP